MDIEGPERDDEVEDSMAEPWKGPSPRDSTKINWYRSTESK